MTRRKLLIVAAALVFPKAPSRSLKTPWTDVDMALDAYLHNPFSAIAAWQVRHAAGRMRRAMEAAGITPQEQTEYEMLCGLQLVEAFERPPKEVPLIGLADSAVSG